MSKKAKNTFIGGLDQDTSKSKYSNTKYYRGTNIKVLTEEGLSTGNIENEDGNTLSFTLPDLAPVIKIQFADVEEPVSDSIVISYLHPTTGVITNITVTGGDVETLYKNLNIALEPLLTDKTIKLINSGSYILLFTYQDYNTTFPQFECTTGNILIVTEVPAVTGLKINGWGILREEIVLFTTSSDSETPSGTDGQIWKFSYNLSTNEIDNANNNILDPYYHLKYNNILNFSTYWHIGTEAIGHYENSQVGRIYWTDEYNPLRAANLLDLNLLGLPPSSLAISSDYKSSIPIITNVSGGGSLPAGIMVQYCYRLAKTGGQFTAVSPVTNPMPLGAFNPTSPASPNRYWEAWGADSGGLYSSHAVTYELTGIDTSYNLIEHIAVVTDIVGTTVYKFHEESVPQDGTLTVTHSGPGMNIPISIEEFTEINKTFKRCKTITVKDKRLIAANLYLDTPIVDNYDARAYRFNPLRIAKLTDNERTTIEIDGVTKEYVSNSDLDWLDIPFDYDCINPFNLDEDNESYKYQANGNQLGGEGPNIKYKFTTKSIEVKNRLYGHNPDGTYEFHGVGRITTSDRTTTKLNNKEVLIVDEFRSFKGGSVCVNFTGYARGEIYRFGITFFDLDGNPFETKWIGDIRFPGADENDIRIQPWTKNYVLNTASSGQIQCPSIGIQFDVDISGIKSYISGFEVVRVERPLNDRTKLGTGILSNFVGSLYGPGPRRNGVSMGTIQDNFNGFITGSSTENFVALLDRPAFSSTQLSPNNRTFSFVSPITYFNSHGNNFNVKSGDKVRTIGFIGDTYEGGVGVFPVLQTLFSIPPITPSYSYIMASTIANSVCYNFSSSVIQETRTVEKGQISPAGGAYPAGTFVTQAGVALLNGSPTAAIPSSTPTSEGLPYSRGCQKAILQLDDHFTYYGPGTISNPSGGIVDPYYATKWRIVSYERALPNQYGGNTFEARSANTYISSGAYTAVDNTSPNIMTNFTVYGGDVYTQYFASQYFWYDADGGSTGKSKYMYGLGFPCESPVNVEFQRNISPDKAFGNEEYRQDLLGFGGVTLNETTLVGPCNNFYETLYSKNNNSKLIYFPKSFLQLDNYEFPHRIWASEKKLDGELFDSWRLFLPNTFSEVEGMYGQINKIITERDLLMFYQDVAMGVASVNDRTSVPSEDGTTIVLGKGGILDHYQYISRKTGTKHKFSVVPGSTGVHHFDSNLMKWFLYSQGAQPLSDIKGLHSLFKTFDGNLLGNDRILTGRGIHGIYDRVRNKVYMTFLDAKKDYLESYPIIEIITNVNSPLLGLKGIDVGKHSIYAGDKVRITGTCTLWTSTLGIHTYDFNNLEYTVEEVVGKDHIIINLGFDQALMFVPQPGTDVVVYNQKFNYSVSYNENIQAFESDYNCHPRLYLENSGNLFTVPQNLVEGYRHYDGLKNQFYGYTYPSVLELVIAPDSDITKVFDNIEYKGEIFIQDVDQSNLTIQEAQFLNDHQDSGNITLTVGANVVRRLRSWRMNVFRDSKSPRGDARMRDYFIKLILKHTPRLMDYTVTQYDTFTPLTPEMTFTAPNIGSNKALIGSKAIVSGDAYIFISGSGYTLYNFSGEYTVLDMPTNNTIVIDLGFTVASSLVNGPANNIVVQLLSNERMVLHDIITTYRYSTN